MVDYRPLDEGHQDVYLAYTGYAFAPEIDSDPGDPDDATAERLKMGEHRGLFADDAGADDSPVCVCTHFPFQALIRGERHAAPGLSAVATPPEHRRQGYVRALLSAALDEYRTRDDRVSILWPFRHEFYHKYGWATCSMEHTYRCDPDALAFARERVGEPGQYRRVDTDEYDLLATVYDEFTSGYTLSVHRDEQWWKLRTFTSWQTDPYVTVWERDGHPRAYLTYAIDREQEERTMTVRDLAFLDFEALLAICQYLANHDSQVSTVTFTLPPDVDLLDSMPDPEEMTCERLTGAMARIVDVEQTLSALAYPSVDETVSIEVEDPLVEWNDGVFHLTVRDGRADCERMSGVSETDADSIADFDADSNVDSDSRAAADTDCRLDIGTLTQLVVGYRSAAELERSCRLSVDSDTLSRLNRIFPPEQTYLQTGF